MCMYVCMYVLWSRNAVFWDAVTAVSVTEVGFRSLKAKERNICEIHK
jgi:hypothetical protein